MSDNTVLNAGSGGDTIATEDLGGGVKLPRSKLVLGATHADSGDVSATNPLPAQISDGTHTAALSNATPTGTEYGVITRPIPSGTQAVSGTLTVQQSTAGNLKVDLSGTAANSTAIKVDGSATTQPVAQTNIATADYDSGAGTVTQSMIGLALPASGGPVAGGTSSNPVRIDPTGTTTQPISGSITANVGTTNGLALDATLTGGSQQAKITDGTHTAALTNTTPAGTEYAVITRPIVSGTQTVSGTVTANAGTGSFTVAQATASNLKVDLSGTAANSTAIKVDNSGVTQPISGSITANVGTTNGLALDATLTGGTAQAKITDGTHSAALSNSTPAGTEYGLITRPIPSGTQTVSGTVTANAGTGTFTVAQTNIATADYDSGAGTVTQSMVGLALPASGGPVAGGTSTNPIRTDPTGTTTQPVSGTVTSNIGTTNGLALDATLTGGSQQAKITDGSHTAALTNTTPAGTEYGLITRPIPSGTQTISGTVTANAGTGSFTVAGTAAAGAAISGNPVMCGGSDGTNAQSFATDTSGNQKVVGSIASGSADSGNPVKVGGVALSANPADTSTGNRVNLWCGLKGQTIIGIPTNANISEGTLSAGAAILDTNSNSKALGVVPYNYSGATLFMQRGVTDLTLLASAARTATTASADQTNYNGRGVRVILVVTVASGTGGLQCEIQGKDSISNNYYQLNTDPTAVTGTGTFVYDLYPSTMDAAANGITQKTQTFVPRTWRVNVKAGDSSSYTYSLSGVTIL